MNVAYINPFIRAASNVFSTMVKVPATLGKPYLLTPELHMEKKCRISVSLALDGAVSGMVVLSMSEAAAMSLASGLTGTAVGRLDADCYDAVAEIANMIAGSAKKDLPGGLSTVSTPTVVQTREVVFPPGPVVVIPFETGVGLFVIEVGLREAA
jgi:chemotaxis protein CheX